MDIKRFNQDAAQALSQARYSPKKLALLHTGAAVLVSLVLTVLNFILDRSIGQTGGIANLGSRAVLSTLQAVLTTAGSVLLPFWEIGFAAAALRMWRSQDAGPRDLCEGFYRFRQVLRLFVLQICILFLVAIICSQLSGVLFSFTPFMKEAMVGLEALAEQAAQAGQAGILEEDLMTLLPVLTPMYVIFGVLMVVVGIPLFYRLRLAQFAIMDDAPGARKALGCSSRITRGYKWQLFRLDLQFWWYYAAQVLIAVIAYADLLLPRLGIALPVSQTVLYFGSYGVYMALRLAMAWLFTSRVQTAYAGFYTYVKAHPWLPPVPPAPNEVPWDQT